MQAWIKNWRILNSVLRNLIDHSVFKDFNSRLRVLLMFLKAFDGTSVQPKCYFLVLLKPSDLIRPFYLIRDRVFCFSSFLLLNSSWNDFSCSLAYRAYRWYACHSCSDVIGPFIMICLITKMSGLLYAFSAFYYGVKAFVVAGRLVTASGRSLAFDLTRLLCIFILSAAGSTAGWLPVIICLIFPPSLDSRFINNWYSITLILFVPLLVKVLPVLATCNGIGYKPSWKERSMHWRPVPTRCVLSTEIPAQVRKWSRQCLVLFVAATNTRIRIGTTEISVISPFATVDSETFW